MYLFYNPNESSITAVPEYVGINAYVYPMVINSF